MTQLSTPLTSDTFADHQASSITVNGITYPNISDVNIDQTIEDAEFRGTSPEASGFTAGTVSYEASFTMPLYDYMSLLSNINESGGGIGYAPVLFDCTVTYKTPAGDSVKKVALLDCKLHGGPITSTSGPDPITVEVSMAVRSVSYDGVKAFVTA